MERKLLQNELVENNEASRDRLNRFELAELILRQLQGDGVLEPLPGLRLTRASAPTDRIYGVTKPSLCIIVQGAKELYLGDQTFPYDPDHFLLATVELPVTGRVVRASPEQPYLALRLDFEPADIASVMVEMGQPTPATAGNAKAVVVSRLPSELLDAAVRLARLVETPADLKMLLPMIKREIIYRLLQGEQGSRLRHIPMNGGHSDRIAAAIDRLRTGYSQPLRIDALAHELGMSPSGFHHHFKLVTEMSPLQYQKQLRLHEARRLMLGESLDAASAGYRVGYEDPSHFSRDYKRHFGQSPVRDVGRLRSMVSAD